MKSARGLRAGFLELTIQNGFNQMFSRHLQWHMPWFDQEMMPQLYHILLHNGKIERFYFEKSFPIIEQYTVQLDHFPLLDQAVRYTVR